jgi:hypothetical protein
LDIYKKSGLPIAAFGRRLEKYIRIEMGRGEKVTLNYESEKPFESIEGAQEYLKLLHAAVLEARQEVEGDVHAQATVEPQRRLEALRLVLYKLEQLEKHVKTSHRILNDLRTLRRLLLEERLLRAEEAPATECSEQKIHELDGAC